MALCLWFARQLRVRFIWEIAARIGEGCDGFRLSRGKAKNA